MVEAALWGLLATSSLVIGAEVVFAFKLSRMLVGLFMAFGVGALIASVSFELIAPAMESSGTWRVSLGLATGALVFFLGDLSIERMGKSGAGEQDERPAPGQGKSSLGIVLGTALDGLPESAVLGMSLVGAGQVSGALLVGIWLSNFPEALAATVGMQGSGWPKTKIRATWASIVAGSAVAAAVGFFVVEHSSTLTGSFVQAFAAGALLTMIADEMMPEAYERSSLYAGLATTAGFALAGLLTGLE